MPAAHGSDTSCLSDEELGDLRLLGADVEDHFAITEYRVTYILGVHFRSGEWGKCRCGSVITAVCSGRSVYARVNKFITVDGDDCAGHACVTWFGAPEYPLYGSPLVVWCREIDTDRLVDSYGCVLRITMIDPSQVMVEREEDHQYCWMMRDSGFDTIRGAEEGLWLGLIILLGLI